MFRKKNKQEEQNLTDEAKSPSTKKTATPEKSSSAVGPPVAASPATETPPTAAAPSETAAPAPSEARQVGFDESELVTCYANFCRVTGTPEEVIFDIGLNPQAIGAPIDDVKVSQRIVFNFFTAKRILSALHATVSRHEQVFGPLETDVRKRAIPAEPST